MSDTSSTPTPTPTPTSETYSGDITLTGSLESPIEVIDPDDVFIRMNAVTENMRTNNAENVFTHYSDSDSDSDSDLDSDSSEGSETATDIATTVRGDGDLEDGYVQAGAVDGDLLVTDAEDVFVPAHAASGEFEISGAENVYSGTEIDVPSDPDAYDSSTTGWRQSATISDPETGVYATGAHHTIEIDRTTTDIDVYVVGYGHDVTIRGRAAAVNVCILGYENTIRIGPHLSIADRTETGFDNDVIDEPYPVEDLIETSKREALKNAGFGRHKTTYQQPATDEEWCPNCGTAADAIVERHQLDAWFLFGHPIKVYGKSVNPAMECEHCSMNTVSETLSERERKNVLS